MLGYRDQLKKLEWRHCGGERKIAREILNPLTRSNSSLAREWGASIHRSQETARGARSSFSAAALLIPLPLGPIHPPTPRPYSSPYPYPFWKGNPALRAVSCYLPELMDLRFRGQFSSLRHSASTLVFSADLIGIILLHIDRTYPNIKILLFSSKKLLKTVLYENACLMNGKE